MDKANAYAILAITYKNGEANQKLAKEAWARLVELGLPAAMPYENKSKQMLSIFVGAAPKVADLDSLLLRVKAATTARGARDFADARGVPIDKYIVRK